MNMKYAQNILETIGNTPLIKLNTIIEDIEALVLAKVESFNPGNSVKDRMAVKMIEDASEERIDESLRRILKQKFLEGLWLPQLMNG